MPFHITKTEDLTKSTVYYNGVSTGWTDKKTLRYVYDTKEKADAAVTRDKLYGAQVVSE